jgi:hypothetical protein
MLKSIKDLNKRIEEYSEELFADLGPVALPEEKKADVYARVQEHLHRIILATLTPVLGHAEISRIHETLEQEDYRALGKILKHYPQYQQTVDTRIDEEFKNLKLMIAEEQKNASSGTPSPAAGS